MEAGSLLVEGFAANGCDSCGCLILVSNPKIHTMRGAPDQRMPPQSFLVRPEWIIHGLYPGTRRSVAHASVQLPSGSPFPSVLERKHVIF